ncbi:AraC family transcriptional regulator [Vibrio palustris]|uniref:HTH-type transcriptional regulator VirS n=1 Tax=Vibrio palustris TaxID=1918946 RepID=A0A1R4B771_9VIBR|nr:AraC family transcriptional regulator [Vibrio palustris]SJL84721.1 HTH-type transcriptional regulator VirS [Vibrio palustris]
MDMSCTHSHYVMKALSQPPAGNQGVLAAAATGLSTFISQQGGDIDRILGRSGVNPEILTQPTSSLKLTHYCQVLEQAAQQTGCEHFGLYYGQQFMPQQLGLIGYIGLCSATVQDALTNLVHAFGWHQHDTFMQFVDLGDAVRVDYQIRHGGIVVRRQDAELTMGMVINLIRQGAGKAWAPRMVHFEHASPESWHEHCKVFDAPVYFNQPFNSMVIDKTCLSRSMPNADPMLLSLMMEALQRLNVSQATQSMAEQVRASIQTHLVDGEPELDKIADVMGMNRLSLQRRLKAESVTYRQLLESVRRDLASHYLQQAHIPITEMGLLLGYSETSAFSRAFRRWFGVSPRQYRTN